MDNMMTDVALMAMDMKATQYRQSYDVSVAKKAMDTQEDLAVKMITDMMPQVPKGDFIDVYA